MALYKLIQRIHQAFLLVQRTVISVKFLHTNHFRHPFKSVCVFLSDYRKSLLSLWFIKDFSYFAFYNRLQIPIKLGYLESYVLKVNIQHFHSETVFELTHEFIFVFWKRNVTMIYSDFMVLLLSFLLCCPLNTKTPRFQRLLLQSGFAQSTEYAKQFPRSNTWENEILLSFWMIVDRLWFIQFICCYVSYEYIALFLKESYFNIRKLAYLCMSKISKKCW